MYNNLYKDQHTWNAFFFILFPIAAILSFWLLQKTETVSTLWSLGVFDIAILSLATFRVVRLVVADKIFSFGRSLFNNTLSDGTEMKPESGFRRAVAELIECPWCVGVWAVLLVIVLYIIAPVGRFFVMLLAIAALGSLIQILSRRIGSDNNHTASHVCS